MNNTGISKQGKIFVKGSKRQNIYAGQTPKRYPFFSYNFVEHVLHRIQLLRPNLERYLRPSHIWYKALRAKTLKKRSKGGYFHH